MGSFRPIDSHSGDAGTSKFSCVKKLQNPPVWKESCWASTAAQFLTGPVKQVKRRNNMAKHQDRNLVHWLWIFLAKSCFSGQQKTPSFKVITLIFQEVWVGRMDEEISSTDTPTDSSDVESGGSSTFSSGGETNASALKISFVLVAQCVLGVLGVFSNATVVLVFATHKKYRRKIPNMFIINQVSFSTFFWFSVETFFKLVLTLAKDNIQRKEQQLSRPFSRVTTTHNTVVLAQFPCLQLTLQCSGLFWSEVVNSILCVNTNNLYKFLFCLSLIFLQSSVDFLCSLMLCVTSLTVVNAGKLHSSGWLGEVECKLWNNKFFLWGPLISSTWNLVFLTFER